MCGENRDIRCTRRTTNGSSPRVRGKRLRIYRCLRSNGLIPACAGKTECSDPGGWRVRAHPRVCGENRHRNLRLLLPEGSSPRVRGKHQRPHPGHQKYGLIPACAGKTGRIETVTGVLRAHPRVCGENPERSGVLTLRSVRSWKTLSFPPSLKVTHCRAFVQLSRSRIRLRILAAPLGIVRPHHQSNPFEINWFPWITPRQKREPLLIARAIHHHRTAGSHVLSDDRPQTLTHTSAQSPNKDSRRNLK